MGARTINESVLSHLEVIEKSDIQFIWQTGKYYSASIQEQLKGKEIPNLKVLDFISDMGAAYRAATWSSAEQVPAASASSVSSASQ